MNDAKSNALKITVYPPGADHKHQVLMEFGDTAECVLLHGDCWEDFLGGRASKEYEAAKVAFYEGNPVELRCVLV